MDSYTSLVVTPKFSDRNPVYFALVYSSLRSNTKLFQNNSSFDDYSSSNYYYSNGLVYNSATIQMQKPSTFLTKVSKMKKNSYFRSKRSNYNSIDISNQVTSSFNTNLDKRFRLNKNHPNLVSLDETALHLYRKEHRLNRIKRERNRFNSSISSTGSSNTRSKQLQATKSPNRAYASHLKAAHANFISLQVDDSETKPWPDSNLGYRKSVNASDKLSPGENVEISVERKINPKSSMRRHMFINSRRNPLVSSIACKYSKN